MGAAERYKDNPHAPQIRFIRKGGRVIPIAVGDKYAKPMVAAKHLNAQLELMSTAVDNAERGKRVHLGYGTDHEVRGMSSTFPKFFSKLHFRSKADFKQTLEADKVGPKQLRLFEEAHNEIKRGEDFGFGAPKDRSIQYQLALRQIFDNQGVVFRKIDGKVVPIRSKGKEPAHHAPKLVGEEPWL